MLTVTVAAVLRHITAAQCSSSGNSPAGSAPKRYHFADNGSRIGFKDVDEIISNFDGAKGPARELLQLIVDSPEHVLLFLLKELERVFQYDRVRAATRLTVEEVGEFLSYITAREVSEIIFPGPAPRIVPSDADDDPVVHTAVVGGAEILCTLNRDFYHPDVLEYCKERGVLIAGDIDILDLLRGRRR